MPSLVFSYLIDFGVIMQSISRSPSASWAIDKAKIGIIWISKEILFVWCFIVVLS